MPSAAHEAFVASLPPGGATPDTSEAMTALLAAEPNIPPPPAPAGFTVEKVSAGGVPSLLVAQAGAAAKRTVIYLHGGGYIYIPVERYVPVMAEVARAAGARCLGLDYRRAPVHPYPAPVEDTLAAYRWLLQDGVRPQDVALVGDSAGGGLVLAALLAIRDRGLPLPAAGASISPWTDLEVVGESADTADDPVCTGSALRFMARTYLAGQDARAPYASPLYGDLAGLPPLQIQVGTRESLLDDSRRFAARARSAGVTVDYLEHEDVAHMWVFYDQAMPEAQAAFTAIGDFLKAHAPET
jgi:acetyl esterase/lipase